MKDAGLNIVETFLSGKCPLCALLERDEFDYLCHWVGIGDKKYENSQTRNRILRAGGFCNYHFWEYQRMSTDYGIAEISIELIDRITQIAKSQDGLETMSGRDCPLCDDLKAKESRYVKEIMALLKVRENQNKYASGVGFCIPHLIRMIRMIKEASLTMFLLEAQHAQLKRIKNDAAAFIRKIHPPARWDQSEDEKKSYLRAIEKLVGRRGTKDGD